MYIQKSIGALLQLKILNWIKSLNLSTGLTGLTVNTSIDGLLPVGAMSESKNTCPAKRRTGVLSPTKELSLVEEL